MSYTYKELRSLDDEQLIAEHDRHAENTCVGVNYYLEELSRRDSERVNKSMLRCTRWMTVMTAVVLIATIVNVIIAFFR